MARPRWGTPKHWSSARANDSAASRPRNPPALGAANLRSAIFALTQPPIPQEFGTLDVTRRKWNTRTRGRSAPS